MSESKHTPGPWKRCKELGGGPWYSIEGSSGWVCQVADPYSPDARLIAACPGLLDLAKRMSGFDCEADVLNPCDSDKSSPVGFHWAGGEACPSCHARQLILKTQP